MPVAANTALLAIPSGSSSNLDFTYTRTATEILAYISTLCSLGAITTALLLIRCVELQAWNNWLPIAPARRRQYRTKAKTAAEAAGHIASHMHERMGLETMAIMQSLP
jgi:hypothetical protein